MKVGDKLMCKKKRYSTTSNFIVGEYYEISFIDEKNIKISKTTYHFVEEGFYCVWHYFYKPEEVRKMKLESL
ncbi:hypothetical protein M0Q50_10075 [bacterium]|jgi:hypothetical protein|nr:hypothetical protein [bacterium]